MATSKPKGGLGVASEWLEEIHHSSFNLLHSLRECGFGMPFQKPCGKAEGRALACFRAWGNLPAELQPGFLNRLQELAYIHGEAWDGGTGQPPAGAVERALGEVSVARLAVDLDLPLPPQHQPTFFHAGAGVGA